MSRRWGRMTALGLIGLMGLTGLWPGGLPVAAASEALARQKACLGCHAVEKKVVGPSFHAIATRYAGDAAAPARLAQKVIHGSQGSWGPVAMPANARVSEAEARELVRWLLTR